MVEEIRLNQEIIAIIIRNEFQEEGLKFYTPNEFSQQLGYMKHPKGHKITPHIHKLVVREVKFTQEVLFIRRGKVKVDLYSDAKEYFQSVILVTGDLILLAAGGHGFEILEDSEIIEVKQGPFINPKEDKEKFFPADTNL